MSETSSNRPVLDADELLAGIREWVEIESPTTDAASVNRMVDKVQADFSAIGRRWSAFPGGTGLATICW